MTISTPAFLTFLGTAILFWLGLLWQYRSKWNNTVESLAKNIRLHNARNGYKANVNKKDLARDYLLPFRNSNIKELVRKNGGNYEHYHSELQESVEKPKIVWRLAFHILGLLFTFSGVTYLFPGGFVSGIWFLGSVVLLYLVSLALFFTV